MNIYLVIYSKNKKIITRLLKNGKFLKVGLRNSYDWEIIDLQILFGKVFILPIQYEKIRYLEYKKRIRKQRKREKIKKIVTLLHDTFS